MQALNPKEVFKAKLFDLFPNKPTFTFSQQDKNLVLKFLNYEICASTLIPNSEDSLFQNAIDLLEKLHSKYKNTINESYENKIKQFRDSKIKNEQNTAAASSVRSKADYYNIEPKRFKKNSCIPGNDACKLFRSDKTSGNSIESLTNKIAEIKTEENIEYSDKRYNDSLDEGSNKYNLDDSIIIFKADKPKINDNSKSNLVDSKKQFPYNNPNIIDIDSKKIHNTDLSVHKCTKDTNSSPIKNQTSGIFKIEDAFLDTSLLFTDKSNSSFRENKVFDSSLIIIPDQVHLGYMNGLNSSEKNLGKFSKENFQKNFFLKYFTENSFNLISESLIKIRNVEKFISATLKKGVLPKLRNSDSEMSNNLSSIHDKSFSSILYNQSESPSDIFSSSILNAQIIKNDKQTVFSSTSQSSNFKEKNIKSNGISSSKNDSLESIQFQVFSSSFLENNNISNENDFSGFIPPSDSIPMLTFSQAYIKSSNQPSNSNTITKPALPSYDSSRIESRNLESPRPKTPPVMVPESENENFKFVGYTGIIFKKTNLKEDKNLNNIKSLNKDLKNQNTLNSFETSCIYDYKTDVFSKEESSNGNIRKIAKIDPSYLKNLIVQNQNTKYGNINIIRSFCSFYKIDLPEYEIVRENDVFRCTATFLNINFVSCYRYDKNDAKDDSCCKIKEYIIENWTKVFEIARPL